MKKMIQSAALVLGVALIAMTGCKKDVQNVVAATSDTEMTALVDQAGSDMQNYDGTDVDPQAGIMMINEGIAADFLVVATDVEFTPGPAGMDDTLRAFARDHSFAPCLRRLTLTDDQKAAIKKAALAYEQCKESAVKRARAIYADLRDKYREKADRLIAAYKNGDISKDKFEAAMKELRIAFHKELRSLQLQEKLDEAFKKCFRGFLDNLHNILTEQQWKAFVSCHKR